MRTFAYVVGAKSASWRSGVCDAIRPHHNLPILQNSPILQIHLYFQLPLMGGRIALKGRANCPQRKGELPTMDGRIAIRPYTCVIRTLANIHINHVNTQKKRRHGHGMREFACVVGANCNSPMLQFTHIAKFIHVAKFAHISNSPIWKGELQFAPTRVFSGCWQIYM